MSYWEIAGHFWNFALRCLSLWWSWAGLAAPGVLLGAVHTWREIRKKISSKYYEERLSKWKYIRAIPWAAWSLLRETPSRESVIILAMVLLPAIGFTTWNEHTYWINVNRRRLITIKEQQSTIDQQRKRIAELESGQQAGKRDTRPRWVSDLTFRENWFETAGYKQTARPGNSLSVLASEVIRPPHVWRIELDREAHVEDVTNDHETTYEFRWKQVSRRVIEVQFSGPSISPSRDVILGIFLKDNKEFRVKGVRRLDAPDTLTPPH